LQKEIEERKATEDKIRTLNSQLLQNNAHLKIVNEELDQFAYVASHDLQEPLRKIMVFSDKIMQRSDHQDPETEKYFKKIISSSRRMQSLINDLLNFSRLTRVEMKEQELDLSALISLLAAELTSRGLHPRDGEVPATWIRDKFIVRHLDEHVAQLEGILAAH
jgi:light-regulated signal transduction histidine kinase (bacteriophytochrome)